MSLLSEERDWSWSVFLAVSERSKVPLTFSISVLAHPGGEEGLCSLGPDARQGSCWALEGRRREGSLARDQRLGGGWEGRVRSMWLLPPSHMLGLLPHTVRPALSPPSLPQHALPTCTARSAWQSPSLSLPLCLLYLLLPRAPWLGAGHWDMGRVREKMGIKLREGKAGGDAPGAGEEKGMGRPEACAWWGEGALGSLSQPMWALETLSLWGPHPAGLGAVADKDFPFGVCPFLVSPPPPLLVSASTDLFPPLHPPHPFLVSLHCLSLLCLSPLPLSLPPRPPADHLQQPGCHQDWGPGSISSYSMILFILRWKIKK